MGDLGIGFAGSCFLFHWKGNSHTKSPGKDTIVPTLRISVEAKGVGELREKLRFPLTNIQTTTKSDICQYIWDTNFSHFSEEIDRGWLFLLMPKVKFKPNKRG
jgi:hypothetical protein